MFAAMCCTSSMQAQVTANSLITKFPTARWVFTADGARGIDAPLYQVQSLSTDSSGRVIFADPGNHVVLRINSDGTVNVLAGNGLEGFSGDGGPAVSASLNRPSDAVMDSAGNLYVYDEFNHRIREVTPDGVIRTILGNGVSSESGDGGPALRATVGGSDRLAVDAGGNLYISNGCQIRRITSDGTIKTFAGNTACTHGGDGLPALQASMNPFGMAFDATGNLYFTEASQGYVRKIGTNGVVSTITGGLKYPHSVVADKDGNVFFSEVNNETVTRVAADGTITTFVGVTGQIGYSGDGGAAPQGTMFFPKGLAFDGAGNLHVADSGNFRVRRVRAGIIETVAGNGQFRFVPDGTPASQAYLYGPDNLGFDLYGNLLISEVSFSEVAQIGAADSSFHILAGAGVSGHGVVPRNLINAPRQITTDAEGSIYFVDNLNAVAYKVTDGIALPIAGKYAVSTYTGDNGLAINATLMRPWGIAVDRSGVVFISDAGANVIRRIGLDGMITTYAGTGNAGFAGDGGPSNTAQLNSPWELALDANGNLLICDRGNNRIRKIDPTGTITTVAGTGSAASNGDGGPASKASVKGPFGIAMDVDGGMFLLESNGLKIRRIDANGVITTIAGDGVTKINQGDGGPAGKALLDIDDVAVDSFGNVFVTSFDDDSIRVILNFEPYLYLVHPSFSELPTTKIPLPDAVSGGDHTPPQSFAVGGDFARVLFTATADQPWIVLASTQGTTPSTMSFWGDPAKLSPGEYTGTITLLRVGASRPFAKVAVSMNVVAQLPPRLSVQPSSLSLSTAIGGVQPTQTIHILNTGSGSLDYQINRSSVSANYLRLSTLSGTVKAGSPVDAVVSIDPSSISAGTLSETLLISSKATNQTVNLPVALSVASKPQRLVLSQKGLTFQAVKSGGVTPPQTFAVLNAGGGSFDWTATAATLGGSPSWLSITPKAGTSAAASPAPSITVRADPSVLSTAGTYYGVVRVSSKGAANAPQDVEVVLNVFDSNKNLGASLSRTGLIFVAPAGASSPGSQTIAITNLNASSLMISPQAATFEGIPWLTVAPDAAEQQISPGGAMKLTVAAKVDGLSPGAHRGTVLLQLPSPLVNLEADVQFIVTPSGSAGGQSIATPMARTPARSRETSAAGCTPTALVPIFSTLLNNFAVPAAWPVALEAVVADDCGNPFTSGQVVVSFSNGDAPLSLLSLADGRWQGTWFGTHAGSTLQITLAADSATPLLHGEQKYSGFLQPNNDVPVITSGGVGGAASTSAQASIGPGSIITISGKSLAAAASSATHLPLSNDLAGSEVVLAGINLPLIYAAGGLINAVVPYDLPPGQYLTIVTRGAAYSGPEPIVVGAAQPAIFRISTSTDPQVVQNIWSQLVAGQTIDPTTIPPASPITAGNKLMIYCTGLGPVIPALDPAQPAPSPAPSVAIPVTLTIGNTTVPVSSAALVPGYAGLYLVQATVPSGLSPGTGIPLMISVQGQVSAAVGISVK